MTSRSVHNLGGGGQLAVTTLWGLDGHRLAGSEQLHYASLALCIIIVAVIGITILLFYLILFQLLNGSYLKP